MFWPDETKIRTKITNSPKALLIVCMAKMYLAMHTISKALGLFVASGVKSVMKIDVITSAANILS